jgi:hypothetical protein
LESACDRALSIDGGPMWISQDDRDVGIIGHRVGQLGKNGEYWIGMLRVVWIINSELHGGSPHLCLLRPKSVGSE